MALSGKNAVFLMILALSGCSYKHPIDTFSQEELKGFYEKFKNKNFVVGAGRDKSFVSITTYQESLVNEYYYSWKEGNFLFVRDTIQYLDRNLTEKSIEEGENYLIALVKVLDSLNIKGTSAALSHQGISLKVYLDNGESRLYVENIDLAKNGVWGNYFSKAKEISENWYEIDE